jgi:hypothetical protein
MALHAEVDGDPGRPVKLLEMSLTVTEAQRIQGIALLSCEGQAGRGVYPSAAACSGRAPTRATSRSNEPISAATIPVRPVPTGIGKPRT